MSQLQHLVTLASVEDDALAGRWGGLAQGCQDSV